MHIEYIIADDEKMTIEVDVEHAPFNWLFAIRRVVVLFVVAKGNDIADMIVDIICRNTFSFFTYRVFGTFLCMLTAVLRTIDFTCTGIYMIVSVASKNTFAVRTCIRRICDITHFAMRTAVCHTICFTGTVIRMIVSVAGKSTFAVRTCIRGICYITLYAMRTAVC